MGTKTAIELMQEELFRKSQMFERYSGFWYEQQSFLEMTRIAGSSQLEFLSKATEAARLSFSAADLVGSSLLKTPLAALTKSFAEQATAFQQINRSIASDMGRFALISEQIAARFRMPAIEEMAALRNMLEAAHEATRFVAEKMNFLRAAESFQVAWINIESPLNSLKALSDLNGIGNALKTFQPFESELTGILRSSLGDWRNVTIPQPVYEDALERVDFYAGQGFDLELTNFPQPAFDLILDAAEIRPRSPSLAVRKLEGAVTIELLTDHESMMGFAYDLLFELESRFRAFIHRQMVSRFGEQWLQRQVPGPMRKAWESKRAVALERGEPIQDLIFYADFTDYVTIICRRDNWNSAFREVFLRKEGVQEAFYRLFPIRICTMHARPITQADLLLLFVESDRLLKAIDAKSRRATREVTAR
ncbi:MAG: hypothetical protein ABSB13_01470 [Candidatus Binatus sp.]|jgi:hypothetical protein|uniref:hypothetical protein n=1 Tax=Candidatus Binatus sp. TaxID=2811406 RepID=UPI003D097AA9